MPNDTIKEAVTSYRLMTVRFTDGRSVTTAVRSDIVTDEEVLTGSLAVYEIAFTEAYPLPEGHYFDSWDPQAVDVGRTKH